MGLRRIPSPLLLPPWSIYALDARACTHRRAGPRATKKETSDARLAGLQRSLLRLHRVPRRSRSFVRPLLDRQVLSSSGPPKRRRRERGLLLYREHWRCNDWERKGSCFFLLLLWLLFIFLFFLSSDAGREFGWDRKVTHIRQLYRTGISVGDPS